MEYKEKIEKIIEEKEEVLVNSAEKIWEYAELGFKEHKSSDLIMKILRKEGFKVNSNLAKIETAFVGEYGNGSPVVAILGEYDALSGLDQDKANYERKRFKEVNTGHGCGHNLLGIGSLGAAIAVKELIKENKINGTIRYYGCPGEESGAGKTFMVRDGFFNDIDISLCWHPGNFTGLFSSSTLANLSVFFKFKGKSAHAAAAPFLGRSALDAVELMNVGANYLREHIIPEARLHYAVINTGGISPNIVQDEAEVHYFIRAPKVNQANKILNRLKDVGKGAALMTETDMESRFNEGISDYIPNDVIGEILNKNLMEIGPPKFTDEDYMLASKFRKTLTEDDIENSLNQMKTISEDVRIEEIKEKSLLDLILPISKKDKLMPGSTDVGDVSYVTPTAQIWVASSAIGTPGHSWQLTAQVASSIGFKGMFVASKALAMTAVEIMENPTIIEKAKEELHKKTNGEYICPIPADLKPEI